MSAEFHHPKLESWVEWKEKCAIGLCGEDSRDDLLKFGVPRIIRRFQEFQLGRLVAADSGSTEIKCWHFFESYMHEVSSTSGKRWKDWLFDKAAASEDSTTTVLEKETQYCMKTAVGRHLSLEGEVKSTIVQRGSFSMESLLSGGEENDAPPPASPHEKRSFGRASEDYAPNPAEEAGRSELRVIARALADSYFEGLPHHARVAFLADAMNLSLANPAVVAAAGRKSSVLYACLNSAKASESERPENFGRSTSGSRSPGKYGQVFKELRALADEKFESDDEETFLLLIAAAILALGPIAYAWGKSEKSIAPLFLLEDT